LIYLKLLNTYRIHCFPIYVQFERNLSGALNYLNREKFELGTQSSEWFTYQVYRLHHHRSKNQTSYVEVLWLFVITVTLVIHSQLCH